MASDEVTLIVVFTVVFLIVISIVLFRFRAQYKKRSRSKARYAEGIFVAVATLGGVTIYVILIWASAKMIQYENDPTILPNIGLPPGLSRVYMKVSLVEDFLYVFILWNIKAAFLTIQYDMTRVLPGWHRTLIYVVSAYMVISFLISFFMGLVNCRKRISDMWSYTDSYCSGFSSNTLVLMQYLLNIFGDIFILMLYIIIIYSLSIRGRQIWAFFFIFLLCAATIIASTLRFINVHRLNETAHGIDANNDAFVAYGIWTAIEWLTALVAVCLPSLRSHFRERTAASSRSTFSRPLRSVTSIGRWSDFRYGPWSRRGSDRTSPTSTRSDRVKRSASNLEEARGQQHELALELGPLLTDEQPKKVE